MSRPIPFFAGPEDLLDALIAAEDRVDIKYVAAGIKRSPDIQIYFTASEIPNLGVAESGDQSQEQTYLVLLLDDDLSIREISQRRGGTRFSIDQRANPRSIGIRPGGVFRDSAVISGQLGASTGDPVSAKLEKVFREELQSRFVKIKSYLVGQEALAMLRKGHRLTAGVSFSREYDLSIS